MPSPDGGPGARPGVLDRSALLGPHPDAAWFAANIPFVELPDRRVQEVYYYRWRVFAASLRYTGPDDGHIVREFQGPVDYEAPHGAIVAAAGHHVDEGRWLRDPRYIDDYLRFWFTGPGTRATPPGDHYNEHSTDWAHMYSSWLADAAYRRAQVTGDFAFALELLPAMRRHYDAWAPQSDPRSGLYWQVPVWDAMEYTAGSYQSDDPYHGGAGLRPTINAYQYADARAIAALSRRAGDHTAAADYERRAAALRDAQEALLWDPGHGFYKHAAPVGADPRPIADREQIGFVPWAHHMAPAANAAAWAQLTDPMGFAAPYGPTTVERRSPWFMHGARAGGCRWSGPSWPFATSQTLTGLANLLADYPAQDHVSAADYYAVLHGYARTQYKNGAPYVAEAHDPDRAEWIYDAPGHSEDYNHSTFADLVLSGLLGVRPQPGDSVRLHPLVPAGWDHFAVENLAYHGRDLAVVWDRDGGRYGRGAGLRVRLDGVEVAAQAGLDPLEVPVPAAGAGGAAPG